MSQARCASSLAQYNNGGWGIWRLPANWSCARTEPYKPILAIPTEVLSIDPGWASCVGGINGVYDPPKALTPKSAIATPTLPGGPLEMTSEAVPASTPRPTLATATPIAEPNSASTMASTFQIQHSTPDSPHVNPSPTAAETHDEQTDHHDQALVDLATISTGPPHNVYPPVHPIPIQNPDSEESRPIEHTVLDDPGSRSSIPGDWPKSHEIEAASTPQIDALSVFLAAQSSMDASTRQQAHVEQTQSPDLPATRTGLAGTSEQPFDNIGSSVWVETADVATGGGGSVTTHAAGSSVIMQHATSSVTIASSSETSFGSHIGIVASDGGAIIIDHSVTRTILSYDIQPPALPTSVVGDDHAPTAHSQSAVVVLADGTQTLTIPVGDAITINSYKTNVAANGHGLVVGSSNVAVPANDESVEAASTALWTSDGSTFTAAMRGSSVILYLPTTTATLTAGATTTIADELFGVPVSGSFIEHGSSTLALIPVNGGGPGGPGEATTLVQDGQKLTASAAKGSIIVQQGPSKATLAAGQKITFNGHTLSAAQNGAVLIVDGSVMAVTRTNLPDGTTKKVETASDSRSADVAGVTNTVEVTASSPSTLQSSAAQDHDALGSMANTSLFLRLLCLVVCVGASLALV